MTDVAIWSEVALMSMYSKLGEPAGIQPPRTEWLEGPCMALQICLRDKLNVLKLTPKELQRAIARLAGLYVSIHINLAVKYKSHPSLSVPEGYEMFKRVSSTFIGITRDRGWKISS